MLLYYITDRTAFAADEPTRRRRVLEKIAEAARAGVDYIQLREKHLPTCELESLAREAMAVVREARPTASGDRQAAPALLINSRTDVALAVGADGVHLPADEIAPPEVNEIWRNSPALAGTPRLREPIIGVSCHSPEEVTNAATQGAAFAVFAPVFEKKDAPNSKPTGLDALRRACRARIPVLALGGITLKNARSCIDAGATGIAAIRLFQEHDIEEITGTLS